MNETLNPKNPKLVSGFNPVETYESIWIMKPQIGMKIKNYLSCHHLVITWNVDFYGKCQV